jgi:hypothetical protein
MAALDTDLPSMINQAAREVIAGLSNEEAFDHSPAPADLEREVAFMKNWSSPNLWSGADARFSD